MTPKTGGLIVLIVLFGFLLRTPYFFHRMQDNDEGCHAAIAATLMDGGLPYVNGVDNKPPGIYFIYLVTFYLFGKYNMIAVHMVAFFYTLATAIILSILARKLGGKNAGYFCLLFYLTFTAALYPKMIAANTEIFMALPYSLAVLILWHAYIRESGFLYFLSGFVAGLSPLFKQVGGVEIAAVFAYLLFVIPILFGKKKIRSSIVACLQYGIGFILPIGIVAFLFYKKGILADTIFWIITFPQHYINAGYAHLNFLRQIIEEFVPFVLSTIILWILAFIWIKRTSADLHNEKRSFDSPFSLFLILWLISSTLVTFIGKRMYGHYYIQILPSLCLIASFLAGKLICSQQYSHGKYWKPAIYSLTIIPAIVFLGMALFFEGTTGTYWGMQPDFRPATEYIKAHTNPQDKIFVWGWLTPVYVYSERTPATRFIFTTLLTGYKKGNDPNESDRGDISWVSVPESWPMLQSDLIHTPPKLLIDTSPGNYSYFGRYPIKDFPILRSFVEKNCHPEKSLAGMDIYRCGNGAQ